VGKFDSGWIDFEGDKNFEALKKELLERFGKVRWPEETKVKTILLFRGFYGNTSRI
jgi:hypothetical protein